jgi:hypothetical protein
MFQKKTYDEIVDDIIEQLTKGVIKEKNDWNSDQFKYKLRNTPVRAIVKVEGLLRGSQHTFVKGSDYRQTANDLEWINRGEKPDDATPFHVSYTFGEPTGITDVNPGSVVRTIVEAIAREMDFLYEALDRVYKSGFVDTSTGNALELVVSLLGIERIQPKSATGLVTFGRTTPPDEIEVSREIHLFDGRRDYELKVQPVGRVVQVKGSAEGVETIFENPPDYVLEGNSVRWMSTGKAPDEGASFAVSYVAHERVTVPVGVEVSTSSRDPKRVRTFVATEERTVLLQSDSKWEAQVPVRSTLPGKQGNVPPGAIAVMPKPPLGIEYVVNKEAIFTGTEAETDEQLRDRAKKALEAAGKATLSAMESAIRRIEGVRSVLVQDRPENVAGIVKVIVDGGGDQSVMSAINETRSAGVYVEFQRPRIAAIDVSVTAIALGGVSLGSAQSGLEDRIRDFFSRIDVGQDVVYSRLMVAALASPDIHDLEDLTLVVRKEGVAPQTTTGDNVLVKPDERAQIRNVSVSMKVKQ